MSVNVVPLLTRGRRKRKVKTRNGSLLPRRRVYRTVL